jgi:transcriptional regulator with GAF, ATPase, and Fis domain
LAFKARKPVLVNTTDLQQFHSAFAKQLIAEGVRSACLLPLITPSRILGTLNLASRRDGNFTEADVELLSQVASQIAIALDNALAFREMEALTRHHWPGNVRELQNVIERAVILSTDGMLRVLLPEVKSTPRESSPAPSGLRTLEAVERDHILQALRETDWVIGGPEGAAERLGLQRSTLRSRMDKLGISRT